MGVVAISPIYRKVSVGELTVEFQNKGHGYFETDDLTQEEQVALISTLQFALLFTPDYKPTALEKLRVRYAMKVANYDRPGDPPRYTNEYDFPPYNKPRIHTLQNRRTA
jgi:hypothetical protein